MINSIAKKQITKLLSIVFAVPVAPIWGGLLLIMVLAMAGVFGLIAATGNLFLVALALGGVAGGFAFIYPSFILWTILILGMFAAGIVPMWAEAAGNKALWGISILGLILFAIVLLERFSLKKTVSQTPPFVSWLAAFVIYCLINGIIQSNLQEFFGGFKRYFQVTSITFALCWLTLSLNFTSRLRLFFIVLTFVQLPWVLYQLIVLVPARESFQHAYPGLVPVDVVAGTFGASRYGGGANAEMATFLLTVLAFILAFWRAQLLTYKKGLFLFLAAFIPLFMGETKIVLIFMPVMFLVLFYSEVRANPLWAFMAFTIGTAVTYLAAYVYLQFVGLDSFSEFYRRTFEYNIDGIGYGGLYLNRLTALSFWWAEQGAHNPLSTLFGTGIGTAHGMTGGSVALKYPGYGIGLTALSTLLWEQGILGVGLYYAVFVSALRTAFKLRFSAKNKAYKASATALSATLVVLIFYPVYRSTALESVPFQIFIYSLLGYLAILYKSDANEC